MASQKMLTPDNSKKAVILALNAIIFITDGSIPATAAVDIFADSFSSTNGYSKVSRALRKIRASSKSVDVSSQFCATGSATVDAGDSIIGTMVQHYRNCDLGGAVFDGDLQLDIRDYYSTEVFTDVTFTFKGLRITSSQDDSVFDGTIVTKTDYPGAGFITADMDIRDLVALKAIRVVDYRADFEIYSAYGYPYYGNYLYTVKQFKGRIYDDQGEYFDLGLTPGFDSWPMLLGGSSSLTLSPSGMVAPFQVKLALDADGNGSAEYWLFAALNQLAVSDTNGSAPEFHDDIAPVRLEKGESREIRFGNVIDVDQQFVTVNWQLVDKPEGSSPVVDASADGFVFSSNVAGDYRFAITATDGQYQTSRDINIRVMYDMPAISADVPAIINAEDSISFHVDVLNPEQGNVTVSPIAIPGLGYDHGTASFRSAIPNFGVDQQINIGFVVANEDRQQTVTFPVTVRASADSSGPMMLGIEDFYSWYSSYKSVVGKFTDDTSLEAFDGGNRFQHLYLIGPSGKRYLESFDMNGILGSSQFAVLGVADLDGDGVDELILDAQIGISNYLCAFDVKKRKLLKKSLISNTIYSPQSLKVVVADLDGDGEQELSVLSTGGISIFDSNLNLQWQSDYGGYVGSFLLAANVDSDPAIELVTETGYVLDGVSKTWQQRRGFYVNGSDFFAADTDGDGISEVFVVDGRILHQMTQSGYVDIDIGANIFSNVVVRNVDGDAKSEVVFVTNHDASSSEGPFPPYWYTGVASLAYLDFDGAHTNVVLMRELQRGSSISYSLLYTDVDGDGDPEYLGLNNYGSSNELSSFIYFADLDSQEFFDNTGLRLIDKPIGGISISDSADKFVFCGSFATDRDGSSKNDLYTFDAERMQLDAGLSALIDGQNSTFINNYSLCFTSQLEGHTGSYVVTASNDAYSSYYQFSVAIKVQDVATGEVAFSMHQDIGTNMSTVSIGDIDGDHVSDILVGGNGKLVLIDMASGNQRAAFNLDYSEAVLHIEIADVIAGNGRDELILRTSNRLLVLVYNDDGTFTVAASRPDTSYYSYSDWRPMHVFDANGDGHDDIVISTSYSDSSMRNRVEILDGGLQTLASWNVVGTFDDFQPYVGAGGVASIVSLEREGFEFISRVIWRDPMTGKLIAQSPTLPIGYGRLNLATDARTSKTRVVVMGGDRVYIAQ